MGVLDEDEVGYVCCGGEVVVEEIKGGRGREESGKDEDEEE